MQYDWNYYAQDKAVSKEQELKLINYKQPQKTSNMTKVTIIGSTAVIAKKYTHIKFIKVLTGSYTIDQAMTGHGSNPADWDNIELICKNYANGMDLMFAYDNAYSREDGVLYIGYFNEGLV